jgi:copper transport protein
VTADFCRQNVAEVAGGGTCTPLGIRRGLVAAFALALVVLLALPFEANAHAVLLETRPAPDSSVDSPPETVVLRFSETVTLVRPEDVSIVDQQAKPVVGGPAERDPANSRIITKPFGAGVADGSYTVRYRILSADAHVITGVFVFAVGSGPVGPPVTEGAGEGPSETGPWAISARLFELIGIGGIFGLIAFRRFIWAPAVTHAGGLTPDETRGVLEWFRDRYWGMFAILAMGSLIAEAYLLFVKSASLLGTSVAGALTDPSGVTRALGETPFGSQVQLRAALLVVLFATALVQSALEGQAGGDAPPPTAAGRPIATLVMGVCALVVLGSISAQGHASQAPWSTVSVGADAIHLAAASVWIAGLVMTLTVLRRLPRVAPEGGPLVVARTLARFSRVALVSVGVVVATGTIRAIAELSDPAELWDTGHGRSIVIKIALLGPIGLLAFRNRRIIEALRIVGRPNRPTLRMVHRSVALEIGVSLAIIVVAALLVGQVPGRLA